ncbi:hypothetical protein [Alloprevotella sp. oral taxon 473]|uniref:hypothetical protein n=1 Tax=Alloprevotella sp. oral taxon 473 TaxID=712469 RepID=UPI0002A469BB|nr:hypothetical protein [Alloprevotella sp. oral taxon 473]EKX89937.1 hypothetical protein HMPREF9999_01393 [Alloprevotella sp. oral taxon 473 str. F0040]
MPTITIKNIGPIKEVEEISLNKINVFMGPQSSGKSTIAKIISFCAWVEKDVATNQSLSEYQENKTHFRERLESFHKIKGYFKSNSYIHYQSEVVDIVWKNEECSISWVNKYAYKRSKIAYIPSERNMVILPEARKSEFGNTNIRSFLFDWFEARKKYSNENTMSILNLGVNYYYIEGTEEDHIRGNNNDAEYDILLSNASSGLQSITPLIAMIEYLTKWIYNEDTISFEQDERKQRVNTSLIIEKVLKPYYDKDIFSTTDLRTFAKSFSEKLHEREEKAAKYFEDYKAISDSLFTTKNSQFIIEEPEQNLFPETQRDLVYYFLQKCLNKEGSRLTLTTHSPYVLYALNNCMMADLVSDKMVEDELSNLKCNQSSINPTDVSIYEIREGQVKGTIQGEDGLISDNYFDQKMKDLMDDFYSMLNHYE